MIKVLMFGWEFPPENSGGLGTACLGLTRALTSNDIKITFVLPTKIDILTTDNLNFVFAGNKTSIDIKYVNSIIEPYLSTNEYLKKIKKLKLGLHYGRSLFEEVELYSLKVKELIENTDFDIIHAHDWMSFKAGIEAKTLTNKPLIAHVHSTEADRTGGLNMNQYIYNIEKEGMEKADLIITVSAYTKKQVENYYQIPSSKIKVVHNGIEQTDFPQNLPKKEKLTHFKNAGYKVVLFVGRLTLQKGPDYFLYAAEKVLKYYPKVIFVIAGSGDMEQTIIKLASQLKIAGNVLFAGFLRGKELQKIYQMADLYVMPSVSEPFGLTALESVVNGTPVLVSKQAGVREVLTHVLTTDFWDTEEIASNILAVLNYPSLRLTLLKNSQNQIPGINWQKAAQKCKSIYQNVLDSYFLKPA